MDFLALSREIIEKYFSKMNDKQFEAVTTVDGPLLVLAGAGSGKTTVLVNRILNLVKFGNAYNSNYVPNFTDEDIKIAKDFLDGKTEDIDDTIFSVNPVMPWNILAITFTNKAPNELKDRIKLKLGDKGDDIWAGTFHSVCGKILRRNADLLGYTSHFTIYDTDDQRRLLKDIMKQHDIDEKFVPYRMVLSMISKAKDRLITPEEYEASVGSDYRQKIIAQLYTLYQKSLKRADAMDFDDMIVNTVKLLEENPDVLEHLTNKFKYVLVDEYQDTNYAQYKLVSTLASGKNNICVVGDDDQSIYRFRGATIENILDFEEQYTNAKTIRLEQNYRSTANILDAANNVICNNKGRKGKTLWTDNKKGSKINIYTAPDEREEARFIADSILENVENGAKFSDHAVLYRMNAQSNALENAFVRSGISYKVIGSTKFFDRKEIKDVLSYLHLINNNNDDLRLKRIINEPKRSIGATTVNNAAEIAAQLGVSIFEVLKRADEFAALSRASIKIKQFCDMIEDLTEASNELSISQLFHLMLEKSGYITALELEGEEGKDRIDNVKEFSSNILQYELESEEASLADFLEQISLVSDIDSLDSEANTVLLMTVHSAKGLEFNNVYLIGMEEGIFPGNQSIMAGLSEIEEERRLAYVAITRARENLTITNSFTRMIFGSTNRNAPSRFVKEISSDLCEISGSNQFSTPIFNNTYSEKKGYSFENSFTQNISKPQNNADSSKYTVGLVVNHKTFGKGIIVSVTPLAGDTMLEIAFDNVGTKKIMANYAKLTF